MKAIETLGKRFPHRRVLITGATSGLGEALALRFAQGGFRVAVAGRNPEKVNAMARRIAPMGVETLEIPLEVTCEEDFRQAARQVEAAWGGLDILVNNAGIGGAGAFEEISNESWRQLIDVNLWSVIYGTRAFLPLLRRDGGGYIANVASSAGLLCAPQMASYNVTKSAVIALSRTLAVEYAAEGIGVTVSCPSVFKSALIESSGSAGEAFAGVTGGGLRAQMRKTRYTSLDVADSLLRAMAKRRLYDPVMRDVHVGWLASRWLPEKYNGLLRWLYDRRLWVFATSEG